MSEDLEKEYSRYLREGKTQKATEVANERYGEPEQPSEKELYADLKGVGDELAEILADRFDSFDDFVQADVEDLKPVSGIGEKRAESLLEQVE